MQRFFVTSVQQDILGRSPIDRDTLLKALKHKCKYVMLEVFGGKAPLGEYVKRMQRLEDIQVRLISSHLCVRDPPQSLAPRITTALPKPIDLWRFVCASLMIDSTPKK